MEANRFHVQPEGYAVIMKSQRHFEARSSGANRCLFRRRLVLPVLLAVVALLLPFVFAAGLPARAELRIDITRGVVEPIPIAIVGFTPEGGGSMEMGRNIAQVINADLERSGLFRPLQPGQFPPNAAAVPPAWGPWRDRAVQAVVTGAVGQEADGRLKVSFFLWDIFATQQLVGTVYHSTPQNWRRMAHIIADAIYQRITGEAGYFDTRVVYVSESGPPGNRAKRLAIMDQDGENHRYLTDGRTMVLTPRFAPNMQRITYLAFVNDKPNVYLFDIETGANRLLGTFQGISFAPRFSPDGGTVVFSIAQGGRSNIYAYEVGSGRRVQLTDGSGIDTAPSYSPDGSQIVFESDRGGKQQLYVMSSSGGGVRRISFGDGRYASPVWSPRGDLIAFTKLQGGRFSIGVMRPDGTGERILSTAYHVEGPTWAPNGRVLMYFRESATAGGRGRSSALFSIDLTGANERRVLTPADASDPAWSPLNP
jgi:TolB protein